MAKKKSKKEPKTFAGRISKKLKEPVVSKKVLRPRAEFVIDLRKGRNK